MGVRAKMKTAWLMLIICTLGVVAEGEQPQLLPAPARPGELPKCPVQITNEGALQLGRVYDRSRHEIRVQFRHAGEGAILFRVARSTCPCIAVLEAPMNLNLFPGDTFSLRLQLDASALTPGPFTRHVIVDFGNCESLRFAVYGECVQPVQVSPGTEMDLGSFEGVDVMWKRHFELTTTALAGDAVSFVAPEASERFEFELKPLAHGRHELVIRPRLPLPLGEFHERVSVAVKGLENYSDLQLLLHGHVRGRALVVKNPLLEFTRAEIAGGGAQQRELAIIRVAAEGAQGRGRRRLMPARRQGNGQQVTVDEQQAGTKAIFAKLAEELRWQPATGITVEMQAEDLQLRLRLSLSSEFLQQKPLPTLKLLRGDELLGDIELVVK
ncbi:MAG: hypothetical protein GX617_05555 [Lentisphaerae bacterium]|nr:hypothetical protein [Lentisphaerota bacterium]